MLTSFGLILILGLIGGAIFVKIGLPKIIGMLLVGIVIGPFALSWLDPLVLSASADLRQMALIIILIKAGLSLNLSDLKRVGRPALLLSFVPAIFEIIAYTLLGPIFFDISRAEAALMGSVLAAVSPAVVVPRMTQYIEEGWGTEKAIPQMILAGASMDDIFVIVLFSSFLQMAQGEGASLFSLIQVPVSIILGILLGSLLGYLTSRFFARKASLETTLQVLIILGLSFLLVATERILEGILPVSGLLAVISMAATINRMTPETVSTDLSDSYGKLWLGAEILLFVLVGAAVDIRYTLEAGLPALAIIIIALLARSLGVLLSLVGTNLNKKEKLFTVFAYLPKATVQAAIGSVPLAAGIPAGNVILSVAVLSIIVTAPLGAILMDQTHSKLLVKNEG